LSPKESSEILAAKRRPGGPEKSKTLESVRGRKIFWEGGGNWRHSGVTKKREAERMKTRALNAAATRRIQEGETSFAANPGRDQNFLPSRGERRKKEPGGSDETRVREGPGTTLACHYFSSSETDEQSETFPGGEGETLRGREETL